MIVYKRVEVATQVLKGINEKYGHAMLKYYVITSEVVTENLDLHVMSFGSEIEMHYEENNCKNCISAIVNDITTNKNEILKFTEKLKNNYVTPISLHDIVHDYLATI